MLVLFIMTRGWYIDVSRRSALNRYVGLARALRVSPVGQEQPRTIFDNTVAALARRSARLDLATDVDPELILGRMPAWLSTILETLPSTTSDTATFNPRGYNCLVFYGPDESDEILVCIPWSLAMECHLALRVGVAVVYHPLM